MNFGDLAKFPMQDEDNWIITVVIGGVLILLGVFVIPTLAVYGYMMEVMRGAASGETEPPEFDDWGTLIVDGLKAAIVMFVYQIPAGVIGGIVLLISTALLATGSDAGAGLGILGWLIGLGVWMFLSIVFSYFGSVGVVNMALEGSFGAAFSVGTIISVSTSGSWIKAWVFLIGLSFVSGMVASLTGGLAYPFTSFYTLSAGGRALGEAFVAETGAQVTRDEAPAAATA
jgi:hypothetical protein